MYLGQLLFIWIRERDTKSLWSSQSAWVQRRTCCNQRLLGVISGRTSWKVDPPPSGHFVFAIPDRLVLVQQSAAIRIPALVWDRPLSLGFAFNSSWEVCFVAPCKPPTWNSLPHSLRLQVFLAPWRVTDRCVQSTEAEGSLWRTSGCTSMSSELSGPPPPQNPWLPWPSVWQFPSLCKHLEPPCAVNPPSSSQRIRTGGLLDHGIRMNIPRGNETCGPGRDAF